MTEQFVVFATPTLGEGVCSEYLQSYWRTTRLLDKAGIRHHWIKQGGDPFVQHARNNLLTDFLTKFPDATDLFWIDDDVGWPPRKAIEFLARPEEIVTASPPKKSTQVGWPIDLCVYPETGELVENEDGLLKAALIPFGFVRMKRSAVAKMAANALIFREPISDSASREVYNVFQAEVCDGRVKEIAGKIYVGPGADENHFWGEDQVFCLKWYHLGGEIWLDPDVNFSHRGRSIWIASFMNNLKFFRERARETFAQPTKAAE